MSKRIFSLILCLCLLASLAFPVLAEEIGETEEAEQAAVTELTISSTDDFLAFAENCRLDSYSVNLVVYLEADIDLTGRDFRGIPIFCGTLEGGGHTISGLSITNDGSVQGLFRYLTGTALVRELHVEGLVAPQGSRATIGGIAGSNAGKIESCSFSGDISGGDSIGGIVGVNLVSGILEDCQVSGSIHGSHFVGGMAGENFGVIRSCENQAQINTTAQQNSVELGDITMDTLTNSESPSTVTDIGGIAGSSSGLIRGCENYGDVGYKHMGYNIGGIAGSQTGYIVDCANYGAVSGRKEVGGIVGQMEPVTMIEYSTDTLQTLQEQLDTMSALAGQASANAQSGAANVSSQISALQSQTDTAKGAVDQLLPDPDDPSLPDSDSVLAAQNALSSSISAMPGTVDSIASATQSTMSTLSRDMQALTSQIGAMSETLNNASENLGGTLRDISDQDTAEDLTGKIALCVNYGPILADRNVGGIVGAISFENDLDQDEDLQFSGDSSLNFDGQMRAVILDCENCGDITAVKQNAGGIVGWQALGLVRNCRNTGALDAEAASYVGGVCGQSLGYVRSNSAKCRISGDSYVGGIAGSGTIVTNCRSMVLLEGGSEKLGAVLGCQEESATEEESPVLGNFYLTTGTDLGGIDGISYAGQAEPLAQEVFLALEDLHKMFRRVNITFRHADGTVETVSLAPGAALEDEDIPVLPAIDGCVGSWEGLEDLDLSQILFDLSFEAVYTGRDMTIQSAETRENGLPVLLVQGSFALNASVSLSESQAAPALGKGEALLESWELALSESDQVSAGRYQLPADQNGDNLRLLVRSGDGSWRETEFTVDGSYLVFPLADVTGFALVQAAADPLPWILGGVGALVILAAAVWLLAKKRKKK